MKSHLIPWSICPSCGALTEAALNLEKDAPRSSDGDIAICIHCAGVSVFDSTVTEGRRLPTEAEESALNVSESARRAVALARQYLAEKSSS